MSASGQDPVAAVTGSQRCCRCDSQASWRRRTRARPVGVEVRQARIGVARSQRFSSRRWLQEAGRQARARVAFGAGKGCLRHGQGLPPERARVGCATGQVVALEAARLWARVGRHVDRVGQEVQRRRQLGRNSDPDAVGQERLNARGGILVVDDVCRAWLMDALSQAPALTSQQLQRARRRLAQP